MLRARIRNAVDAAERVALRGLQADILHAPEAFQFWCCESWKVMNWVVTRKALYLRGSQELDPDKDVECEDLAWQSEPEAFEPEEPPRKRIRAKTRAQLVAHRDSAGNAADEQGVFPR